MSFKLLFTFSITYFFFRSSGQHTPLEQLDKKHFSKGSHGVKVKGAAVASQQNSDAKRIGLMEAKLTRICELLNEVCSAFT